VKGLTERLLVLEVHRRADRVEDQTSDSPAQWSLSQNPSEVKLEAFAATATDAEINCCVDAYLSDLEPFGGNDLPFAAF
jgi:hypothetical protein